MLTVIHSETVDETPLEIQQAEPDGDEQRQEWFRSMWEGKQTETSAEPDQEAAALPDTEQQQEDAGDEGDFGDDFDEFNEGGEDEDFGDFDEADSTPHRAISMHVRPSIPRQSTVRVRQDPETSAGDVSSDASKRSCTTCHPRGKCIHAYLAA